MGSHKEVTRANAHAPGEVADFIDFTEVAAPATPASGMVRAYAKTDGALYQKDDAGTETALGGGGSTPTWSDWTPTLTATSTNPTLGNGTLTGRYAELGKTVFFSLTFVFGSTSNAGSGTWQFTLPVTPKSTVANQMAAGRVVDNGTDNILAAAQISGSGGNITGVIVEGFNTVTHASPITWATGDRLEITGMYEAN